MYYLVISIVLFVCLFCNVAPMCDILIEIAIYLKYVTVYCYVSILFKTN